MIGHQKYDLWFDVVRVLIFLEINYKIYISNNIWTAGLLQRDVEAGPRQDVEAGGHQLPLPPRGCGYCQGCRN